MSDSFFQELNLPRPDIYLGVGSGTHAVQTGKIMMEFEKICFEDPPDLAIVVGDVNSTIGCALVAAKLCIPVAHVEAGLRSFDRTMPEEINRVLTDRISDFLFTTCRSADTNLMNEGIEKDKIFFVGNVMIDTLLDHIEVAKRSDIIDRMGLSAGSDIKDYILLTLHRPSNVDDPAALEGILDALNEISQRHPIIFPIHPRTLKQLNKFGFANKIKIIDKISPIDTVVSKSKVYAFPPLGYLDFLALMSNAALMLTDSGGIQEETTILGIPCVTLRFNTERPITVDEGTNIVVGNKPEKIINAVTGVFIDGIKRKKIPEYWDGRAAERIVKVLKNSYNL
jgi:UDP-N-acetylglucosamine 2-epimerase (non-hydrolysing)